MQYVYPLRFSCCVMCVSTQQALVGELSTLLFTSPKVVLMLLVCNHAAYNQHYGSSLEYLLYLQYVCKHPEITSLPLYYEHAHINA